MADQLVTLAIAAGVATVYLMIGNLIVYAALRKMSATQRAAERANPGAVWMVILGWPLAIVIAIVLALTRKTTR